MVDWRQAYFDQAKSDYVMFKKLTSDETSLCHRLHYLQMTTEKIAKGFLTQPGGTRYPKVHDAFVRFVRIAHTIPNIQGKSNFASVALYQKYVASLLPTAKAIEDLSPEGADHPNPEYPWETAGVIFVPVTYDFAELIPSNPKILKLLRFIDDVFASIQ